MKRWEEMKQFIPLDHEIMTMEEAETACEYCGISYLILSKCEKMEKLVHEMQEEQYINKEFIRERPELLARLGNLESEQKGHEKKLIDLNRHIKHQQDHSNQLLETKREIEAENVRLQESNEFMHQEFKSNIFEIESNNIEKNKILNRVRLRLVDKKRELATIKDKIKQNLLPELADAARDAFINLTTILNEKHRHQIEDQITNNNEYSSNLKKQLDQKDLIMLECNQTNARLRSEIQSLQENSNEHISSQKVHCQELQTKLIHLEDRIECSNLEIMEITSERDKTDKERIKFRKLYDDLKGKERELADEAEKNVLNLKNQIVKLEKDHQKEIIELKHIIQLKTGNDELKNAHDALTKKNAQIYELEKTVKELNSNITAAKHERINTIEAHQSRVRHLQEKYLNDLKIAGNDISNDKECQIRNELLLEKEKSLQSQKKLIESDFNSKIKSLMEIIEKLKIEKDKTAESLNEEMKRRWENRESETQIHMKTLANNAKKQRQLLEDNITRLELELEEATGKVDPVSDRLSRLQNLVNKKDNEIKFLKETVRLECEERMGLVAALAKVRVVNSENLDNASIKSHSPALQNQESEKFQMFQIARSKNLKRLAKQTKQTI